MHGIRITMIISVKIIRLPADIRTRDKSLALSLESPSWMAVVIILPGAKFYFFTTIPFWGSPSLRSKCIGDTMLGNKSAKPFYCTNISSSADL